MVYYAPHKLWIYYPVIATPSITGLCEYRPLGRSVGFYWASARHLVTALATSTLDSQPRRSLHLLQT